MSLVADASVMPTEAAVAEEAPPAVKVGAALLFPALVPRTLMPAVDAALPFPALVLGMLIPPAPVVVGVFADCAGAGAGAWLC